VVAVSIAVVISTKPCGLRSSVSAGIRALLCTRLQDPAEFAASSGRRDRQAAWAGFGFLPPALVPSLLAPGFSYVPSTRPSSPSTSPRRLRSLTVFVRSRRGRARFLHSAPFQWTSTPLGTRPVPLLTQETKIISLCVGIRVEGQVAFINKEGGAFARSVGLLF